MRKCAIGGQSLANAERGVGMSGYKWICWQDRGLIRLRPHWDQGRVLHFGLETGCDYTTIVTPVLDKRVDGYSKIGRYLI